jgi:hypothetical protein
VGKGDVFSGYFREESECKSPKEPLSGENSSKGKNKLILPLREPSSLAQPEQQMLTFIREVQDINTTYKLVQRFFIMLRGRHCAGYLGYLFSKSIGCAW